MRPSRPCLRVRCPRLAWLLGLLLLVGLSACGPAPSDHAVNVEPHASVGGPSESPPISPHSQLPHHTPVTPTASSVPLAAHLASNPAPAPDQQEMPAPLPEHLVLPQWIAQALASPEVPVRLRALDLWAQQGPEAPLDPLVVALDDADDAVRTKAMTIIERQWAVAPFVPAPPFTISTSDTTPGVQSARYWSASTNAENPAVAWYVRFTDGLVLSSVKTNTDHVWCVRGGMNADVY